MIIGTSRSHSEQITGAVLWNLGKQGNKALKSGAQVAQQEGVEKNLIDSVVYGAARPSGRYLASLPEISIIRLMQDFFFWIYSHTLNFLS